MSNLHAFAEAVGHGVRPSHAAAEIRGHVDPPRVRAVIAVLRRYGHAAWAADRARHLAGVLMLDGAMDVDTAHRMLRRVNGGDPEHHYVIPREAAVEALMAWELGGGR